MAQIQFKTRPGELPDRKPKVYFACHADDFDFCFPQITNELLKISDCAIFYYEPGETVALDEAYEMNLGQMHLFVMPVTSRLLCKPNRAMDVEFAYAVEHHIPVLPLMQEQGLLEEYGAKFGELQFLDRTNLDPTAISYEEKLKKYLESVLIGDEMAQKIRAAFDAYVFLSYRKKDRKYAQELMHLLHRDPVCRDIAIWYDEFLTPGENFNDSIKTALEKSGLFVLTVTPNLVNEPNYIINHEYPMAKQTGKPILPAKMVETDPNALRGCYPGIPDAVDPNDHAALTDAVLKALGELGKRENANDPKHNFFIGLAYLAGIDVEVDHRRAVELITAAAESGLTEAMEKLVSMYETGEGVARNHYEAIRWRQKRLELARQAYVQMPSDTTANSYFVCLWSLADAWDAVEQLPQAKTAYEEMLAFARERYRMDNSEWNARNLAVCYGRLGDIAMHTWDLNAAQAWYIQSIEIHERLAMNGSKVGWRDLSIGFSSLTRVLLAQGNVSAAKKWSRRSVEISEFLAETTSAEAQRDLSTAYTRLGDVCKQAEEFPEAKSWYGKGLKIAEALAQTGFEREQHALAISYHQLGNLCAATCEFAEAESWYRKALPVFDELAQKGSLDAKRDLAAVYNNLGNLCEEADYLPGAMAWYRKSLAILESLDHAATMANRQALFSVYQNLGNLCEAEENLTAAKMWHEKGVSALEPLAGAGIMEARTDLCSSYEKMGAYCLEEENLPETRVWYTKWMEIAQTLVVDGYEDYWEDLAVSSHKLGLLEDDMQLLEQAQNAYLELITRWPEEPHYRENLEMVLASIQKRKQQMRRGSALRRFFCGKKE